MKKSKFIKSSIILIIGGFITKLLGMAIKIISVRTIGIETMSLYSLIMPTFLLLISISGLGLTTALNVLISSNKYNNKNLIIYALILSFSIDFIILLFLFLFSKYISIFLLHNNTLSYPLLCIGFTLPFISVSNILRSYFFAKERMLPHVISNILEDLIKLLLIIYFSKYFNNSKELLLSFLIIINIFSELISIIIFLLRIKNISINKNDIKYNKRNFKDLINIALPTLSSKIIGSITYFLEPIILTAVLTKLNYTNNHITLEYGIINTYVLPLILLPSFFINAISNALIPAISKYYSIKDYKSIKRIIKQASIISLMLGLTYLSLLFFKAEYILNIIYKTNLGVNYIKYIIPIFIFYYLESPLLSSMQAMGKANINMKISFYSLIIRSTLLVILLPLKGMYGLLLTLGSNILFTYLYALYIVDTIIKKKL